LPGGSTCFCSGSGGDAVSLTGNLPTLRQKALGDDGATAANRHGCFEHASPAIRAHDLSAVSRGASSLQLRAWLFARTTKRRFIGWMSAPHEPSAITSRFVSPVPAAFALNPLGLTAAEIIGLDCGQAIDASTLRALKQAYLTYPVLIFRDQDLSAPALAAFGRLFGPLEIYLSGAAKAAPPPLASLQERSAPTTPDQMLYAHPEDSGVLIMTNEALSDLTAVAVIDNAECWHSDGSHKPEPYQAVAVHVVQNPASGGGDTEFCDLRLIYEALPAGDKKLLAGLTATHHRSKTLNPRFAGALDDAAREKGTRIAAAIPAMHQPVVRTHPESGRPALYLSPRFTLCIDGAAPDASAGIFHELFALLDDPRFCYRHQWRERDLMIWDNRCLNHRVRGYAAGDIRRRHRITVGGDKPY
jgi:taurine dioxygenase